jgi:galactokinase
MASTTFNGIHVVDPAKGIVFDPGRQWGNYPAGVISILAGRKHPVPGCDILFASTLPDGSGLSSSAAIEVLTAYIFMHQTVHGEKDRIRIAELSREAENTFIGVQCGIMDQFAVAMGKKDSAILLNSRTMEYHYSPFILRDHVLIIMNTNKPRTLAGSAYNQRRQECTDALDLITKKKSIPALADADISDLAFIHDPILKKRARHVITENARVLEGMKLLEKNRLAEFGPLLTASHESLKNDYEVTGHELDSIVYAALDAGGCIGARMTGAGFGGCAIAIVKKNYIVSFTGYVHEKYKNETGLDASFYTCEISDGVHHVQLHVL